MQESQTPPLERVTIVLHHTRSADNVGATARAMANMGLSRLVLAEPAGWDRTQARRVATEAEALLDSAEHLPSLEDAMARATLVIATSARQRKDLAPVHPAEAARILLEEAARGGSPALLFGDERMGLPRWALDRAHGISTVPTSEAARSLNLAQSVLLHAYELRREAGLMEPERRDLAPPMSPEDLERLRRGARALLLQAGYLNPQQPDRILGELERLLVRARPTEREGRLLLALLRQLEWAVGRR